MRGVIDVEIALHNKKNNVDIYKFLTNWQKHMIASVAIGQEPFELQYENDVKRTRDYLTAIKNQDIVQEILARNGYTRFIFHEKCKN